MKTFTTKKFDVVFWAKYQAQHGITAPGVISVSWGGGQVTAMVVKMNGAEGYKFQDKQPSWNQLPYGTEIHVEVGVEMPAPVLTEEVESKTTGPKLGEYSFKVAALVSLKRDLGQPLSEEDVARMTARARELDLATLAKREEIKAEKAKLAKLAKIQKDMAELEKSLAG